MRTAKKEPASCGGYLARVLRDRSAEKWPKTNGKITPDGYLARVSEFDKAMIVAKLKGARDRARRAQGKCEGRKAYAEREGGQELVDRFHESCQKRGI